MAELYAKPYEVIDTGYNPQQTQQSGQDAEVQSYLQSLPPEERQKAIERINAPLSGEELAVMAQSGQRMPTLEDFAEIEKYHKNQEVSFIDGLGKIAEGGEQVMTDLSNAFASFLSDPKDATSKMPATAVEAFAQGTRNFYGMLAQSGNPDSTLFRVKDFLNGSGTIEERYNQYMEALKFTKESSELAEGKRTLVMDKDMINHEVTQAMAYIADPTLFIPFGKVASTGLRAVGLGEKLAMAGARSAAIKNGILGNTIKWGAGQPLEFMGGAVRNTIDYGLEKAGAAFEATTGIGAKEFAQTARMSGVGFSASGIAGHAVPYASTISDAYLVGSSARGFGEALTLVGETMKNNQFGRGVRSWAAESLKQAEKNGVALSPHAKGLLKTLDAVDPLFAYGWNGLETAAEGAMIGGGLGYLSGGEEGMYSGIGAGIALGAVGGTAGKVVADVTGGTNIARRAVQAKMTIEGQKVINADKAMFFQAMQKAAEVRGKDVDLVNSIIIGIDEVAPNFEFHALTPEQFEIEAKRKGYDPKTGKFKETSALDVEFGGDRASKSKAVYVLRSVGGDFVGNRQGFLDALKKASAKDTANPNKPASNIPLNLRKYTDVAKTFEKLSKTQQEAILKEIDAQANVAKELGGTTKLREFYDALTWSESWTDSLVKKFESDREGARKDITEMLAQETDKKGKLTSKGRALTDKLRAEGFLDKEGKLLRERNLLNADLTMSQFEHSKGALIARESDGKSHMYINLTRMGDETFPHELFHTIMRESPMKKHFTDSLVTKLLGTVDKDGNLVRPAEVNIGQVTKFFKKYIELANRNPDGTLDVATADSIFKQVEAALTEYQNAGANKKISDKARGLLENYSEEFGAYYFSHWLMGRNRNTLFFGGELKGIEGIVERTKDSFMDFWQAKISKTNPEFDFSQGLNASFDRSKGLGRIGAIDYYMRDMVRAASNANREAFRPDAMTLDNLKDFERSNGIRNLTSVDSNRRLNPREQVTQNIRLGKEAYKILSGLDKNLRTSKEVIDENGKQVITGRLSENELDALVKGGIVPRAWADKVNQGYAMLDGSISNIFSAGYLGKTEQTTDASYPRLTGKDVAFKNRKAVLTGIDTKVKADGTFYTLFHTLDLAVIEQEANRLWQNTDYRNLWNGDRASMEADFFRYISNASKASTDPKKLDSAALLERGDGLGGQRRDVLHQMGRMALQTGDAYKHQPIAVIPEGIRHSVTTFNIDGMTMPRVDTGTRYDIDMKNAHKFIRENWQPDEMKQEKTPSGVLMTHESGFKFSNINGKTTAYTSVGAKIGTFGSIREAVNASKNKYNSVYKNFDSDFKKFYETKTKETKNFEPLEESERQKAISVEDLFELDSVKAFIGDRLVLKHARDEFIFEKANEIFAEGLSAKESDKIFANIVSSRKKEYETQINRTNELYRIYKNLVRERVDLKSSEITKGLNDFYKSRNMREDGTDGVKLSPEDRQILHDLNEKYISDIREDRLKREQLQRDIYAVETEANKIKEQHENDGSYEFVKYFSEKWQDSRSKTLNEELVLQEMKMQVFHNTKFRTYSGLLESLFAKEFDDQIQTGKPIVLLGTHGTTNARMMMQRAFSDSKLGERYGASGALSSTLGHFMGHSSETSDAYASRPRFGFGHPQGKDKMSVSDIIYKLDEQIQSLERAHDPDKNKNYKPTLEQNDAFIKTLFKLREEKNTLLDLWDKASAEETKAHISLFQEATALYDYLYNATINKQKKITSEEFVLEASRILTILNYLNQNRALLRQGEFINLNNALSKLAEVASGSGDGLEPSPIAFKESLKSFETYKPRVPIELTSVEELSSGAEKRSGILKTNKMGDRSLPVNRKITGSSARDSAEMDMLRLFSSDTFINEAFGLVDKFKYSRESGMPDMHDKFLGEFLEKTTILKIVNEKPYQDYVNKIKELHNKYDFKELMGDEYSRAYPDASQTQIDYTSMKVRALMAFDNPMVVVDPRAYEEHFISPHMIRAIEAGHDGIIFKRFADGGSRDNIIISFKGNTKKIMEIDTSLDSKTVPRKDNNGKLIKQNFQPVDAGESSQPIKGIALDLNKAYDVFRQEYEESTGQSWTQDKFMQRASNWQFFGDENGFVAVRPQRSGFVKLVGMAGDNKSKLRGIQQLQEQKLPVWGMVSKDIKDIAVRRGMREPNMIERAVLKKALNSAALGDAEILGYTSDNGVRLRYPDIGEVTKYMIGSPEYYQKLRSAFGEQVKSKIGFEPTDEAEGGRVYDQNSRQFKTGFIGKWAEENKGLLKGYNIEFIDRGGMGGYRNPNAQNVRIRLQDNSKKGKTVDVGHITAQIDHRGKTGEGVATLSTRLDEAYRGRKLSYALYSEMAERLRSMGVKYVDGMIVNPEGIPIKVREKIIGDTLMIGRDGSYAKARPISQEEGSKIIKRRQASGGEWEGIDVVNELDFNARYQPTEGEQGGRVYTDKQMSSEFIGRYAAENAKVTKGLKPKFSIFGSGDQGNIELMKGQDSIGYINFSFSKATGDALIEYTTVAGKQQGKGYGNLLYSELVERFRSMGMKEVQGMIIDEQGRPQKIRERIIDRENARIGGDRTQIDYVEKDPDSDATHTGVTSYLYNKAWYQPAEPTQSGNKGRYDIDEAIVEKLKEKFKGYRNLTAKDMLEFIVENKGQFSPLAERLLESLDKHGLEAFVQQQTSTLGRNQKGTKGWTYHNYNPNNNTVNMLLERNFQRRRGWTLSFEEIMMEEILHAVSFEKVPEPIKHGRTIEDTSSNVGHFLRNRDKYSVRYDETWKTNLGFEEEWFTIADAYKQVLKQFNTGKFLDGREIDKTAKHNIGYRLSNMAEFIVGITQDKDVQTILSQIKINNSEKSFLTKLLDAIKRIWNFDDSVMDSLLAVTSDAAERVIQREKTQMEKVGMGIFPERAKQFMSGMPEPKFQPSEYTEFKTEQSPVGRIMRNAKGYVITMANNKFRVYNPAKAIIGVYGSEEEAKKRIYKDIPKQ